MDTSSTTGRHPCSRADPELGPATERARPSRVLLLAALVLVIAATEMERELPTRDEIVVRAGMVPVVMHVEGQDGAAVLVLLPFESRETGLAGPGAASLSPVYPGAVFLVPYGAEPAMFPLVVLCVLNAIWLARRGR